MSTMSTLTHGYDGLNSSDEPIPPSEQELFQLIGLAEKVVTNLYLPQRSTEWNLTAVGST